MLTNEEIKTFFSMNHMSMEGDARIRHEGEKQADFRYGCYGVYNGDKFRLKMSRILRLIDEDIFSKGDIGLTLSWSSRSGFAMFNLTTKAEDLMRQMVYEHNAEKMLSEAE